MRRAFVFALLWSALASPRDTAGAAEAGVERLALFDGFVPTWRTHWREQSLFAKPTRYEVVDDAGKPVLRAVSSAANAGLVREIARPSPAMARLNAT